MEAGLDTSSFANSDFNLNAWINATVGLDRDPRSIDRLVQELQYVAADHNASLEEMSAHALLTIPRSIRDVEKVRKSATALKQRMNQLEETIRRIESSSLRSVALLSELDLVKRRLVSCSHILTEADRLREMLQQMEALFAANDSDKIASHLSTMGGSLEALKDIPEFSGAKAQLAQYQDRLEGTVRPQLIRALNQRLTEPTRNCIRVYVEIHRVEQMLEHYYSCRLVPLDQCWNSFSVDPSDSPKVQAQRFAEWLPTFFDLLIAQLTPEAPWAATVFRDVGNEPVLSALVFRIFSHFRHLMEDRVKDALNASEQPLLYLIELHEQFTAFYSHLASILHDYPADAWRHEAALTEPLRRHQSEYGAMEAAHLARALSTLLPESLATLRFNSAISALESASPKVFMACDSAIRRCQQLTMGAESRGLLAALSGMLAAAAGRYTALLDHLRSQANLPPTKDLDSAAHRQHPDARARSAHYHSYDWTFFQGALQLLQLASGMTLRLNSLEDSLRETLAHQEHALFGGSFNISSSAVDFERIPCVLLRTDHEKARALLTLLRALPNQNYKLLPAAHTEFSSFTFAVQSLVFDTLFEHVRELLWRLPASTYTEDQAHSAALAHSQSGGNAPPHSVASPLVTDLPLFSLAPCTAITQVGVHLLTLPQQLAPYADNAALVLSEDAISRFRDRLGDDVVEDFLQSEQKERELLLAQQQQQQEGGQYETQEEEDESFHARHWIALIARCTMKSFMDKVSEISVLSHYGKAQLITDVGYLRNVLSPLGIAPSEGPLAHLLSLLSANTDQFTELSHAASTETERQRVRLVTRMRRDLAAGDAAPRDALPAASSASGDASFLPNEK